MSEETKTDAQVKLETKLSEQLTEMSTLVKAQAEQIKSFGETEEKLGKRIDDQDARIMELVEEIKKEKERADELEKKTGRIAFPTGAEIKTFGEQFIQSEQFKSARSRKATGTDPFMVEGSLLKSITSDPLSAGALVDPMRVAEIIKAPDRPFRLRDLLTVDSTESNAIEFVVETGFANLYTVLTAAAAGAATQVEVESVAGLYDGQTINIGGENVVIDTDGIDPDALTVDFTPALSGAKSIGDPLTSKFFAPTAEGNTKPEGNITYSLDQVGVKTIAHLIPASRQILSDAGQLRGQIDSRLLYGLSLVEEEQILYGDGTGESIQGILTHPDVQDYLWSSGTIGDTKIDAIRRAMTLARVAEYPVTAIVLHPNDWEDIELVKGSDQHYIWLIVGDGVQQRMFRVPVVDTTAIRPGEFLTGALNMGATLYDREEGMIRVSDSHKDYFGKNMLALLAEERAALAIFRPEAFVHGQFDSAPA